jgi:CDP-6-deoxy-D-xylo-4-hexulose-3-dehydrase
MKIPVTGKVYTDIDKQAMIDCILSGQEITYGSWNVQFERLLSEYIGMKYAYFVNSGSSANLLALAAFTSPYMYIDWRIKAGDEIITVAAGFPTTIAPIIQMGCVPVFVDIELGTYNIKIDDLEKALSKKTKGVFIAHTLGNPFDIDAVQDFCDKHGLWLIEDNSDAFGSEYDKSKTGSFGDVSTSSFYPAHHLSTAQGGAVFTQYDFIAKIIASMRGWGKSCSCPPNVDNICGKRFTQKHGDLPLGYDHKYVFSHFGYNLQGTNILAALGCSQIQRIDTFTKQRHANFKHLDDFLYSANLPILLPKTYLKSRPSWFGYPILVNRGIDRNRIVKELSKCGVETRTLFAGNILKQPCFVDSPDTRYRQIGELENTNLVMNNLFWVGCYHGLNEDHMQIIEQALVEVFIYEPT